ncbi:MAG: hypothetical protein ACK5E6_06015 [Cyanobacteriota bacterium]|jgi:hypothetical protein
MGLQRPGPEPADPITPHATPAIDPQGRLTYIGEDGRRYVVADPPDPQPPPPTPPPPPQLPRS